MLDSQVPYIQWLRSRMGPRKLFLAFASVVLQDEHGAVLLQRRADFDVWGLPGGILELGESILDCARRELREETGLTAGALRLTGVYSEPAYDCVYPNGDQVQQYTVCFHGHAAGGRLQGDGLETTDLRFFPPEQIPFVELPVFYQAMIRDALGSGPPAFQPPFTLPETVDQIKLLRSHLGHALMIAVGAIGVTQRADGRLLMGLRSDDGQWDFPGGFSNLGENVAHTVVRETFEETGLQVIPERILGLYSMPQAWTYPNGDRTQSLGTVFRARLVGGEQHADRLETRSVAWLSPDEILGLDAQPAYRAFYRAVLAHLESGVFLFIGPDHPDGLQ